MSPSDLKQDPANGTPLGGRAVEKIAAETGKPLADVVAETDALKALAADIAALPDGATPTPSMVCRGLTTFSKLYAADQQLGQRYDPFVDPRTMPVTSVMMVTTAMMQATSVEIFELGMWQAWAQS